jgi:hypothetical protein
MVIGYDFFVARRESNLDEMKITKYILILVSN